MALECAGKRAGERDCVPRVLRMSLLTQRQL